MTETPRRSSGLAPFDLVTNGGLGIASSYLISGGPGAGKSTLLSQILFSARRPDGDLCERLMWATAEETVPQIAARAHRIGAAHPRIRVVREENVDRIIAIARKFQPEILVVDSVQTIATDDIASQVGTVEQVKACARKLDRYAKDPEERVHPSVVLICQETKDGKSAGPNQLNHLVDVLLSLEVSDEFEWLRYLTSAKNRLGSTLHTGRFEMGDGGLKPVDPPDESDEDVVRQDEMLPIAQELLYLLLEAGGNLDAGLRDRLAGRLDLHPRGAR